MFEANPYELIRHPICYACSHNNKIELAQQLFTLDADGVMLY